MQAHNGERGHPQIGGENRLRVRQVDPPEHEIVGDETRHHAEGGKRALVLLDPAEKRLGALDGGREAARLTTILRTVIGNSCRKSSRRDRRPRRRYRRPLCAPAGSDTFRGLSAAFFRHAASPIASRGSCRAGRTGSSVGPPARRCARRANCRCHGPNSCWCAAGSEDPNSSPPAARRRICANASD